MKSLKFIILTLLPLVYSTVYSFHQLEPEVGKVSEPVVEPKEPVWKQSPIYEPKTAPKPVNVPSEPGLETQKTPEQKSTPSVVTVSGPEKSGEVTIQTTKTSDAEIRDALTSGDMSSVPSEDLASYVQANPETFADEVTTESLLTTTEEQKDSIISGLRNLISLGKFDQVSPAIVKLSQKIYEGLNVLARSAAAVPPVTLAFLVGFFAELVRVEYDGSAYAIGKGIKHIFTRGDASVLLALPILPLLAAKWAAISLTYQPLRSGIESAKNTLENLKLLQ